MRYLRVAQYVHAVAECWQVVVQAVDGEFVRQRLYGVSMQQLPRTPQEAERFIRESVHVSRQMIVQAKAYLLGQEVGRVDRLLEQLLEHFEARKPTMVVVNPQVDFMPSLNQVVAWLSWTLAACEALWELIHANLLLPRGTNTTGELGGVGWTTVIPGSGGESSGWSFNDLGLPVPSQVIKPRSRMDAGDQPLVDHDLFMREIGIQGIHAEVEAALREAVRCFRHELYTACLAMLGKAAEGAWIGLGFALLKSPEAVANLDTGKHRATLESPGIGVAKKIAEVVKLYERQDIFGAIARRAEIRPQDLRNSVVWADAVRDSRNTVHYGVQPAMRNSYEKVGALLIGAVAHLRILYLVIQAAEESVPT